MKLTSVSPRLAALAADRPDIFASFQVDGEAMVGMVFIKAGSTDHFWEKHGDGDEILYLLEGRARFTAVAPDGTTSEALAGAGDLLLLHRNEAHQAHVLDDLRLIFVTPQTGNDAWTDDPDVAPRH